MIRARLYDDQPSPSIDKLWVEAGERPALISAGADSLAVTLSRLVVNRYLPILLRDSKA